MKPRGTLTFDCETHEAGLLYSMPPQQFVRLIGYAWDEGPVTITTDLEELRAQILKARWIIGHNIHTFDLRAVFGIESNIPMQLADQGRVYDTFTHAGLVHPAPTQYINRHGKQRFARKPEEMLVWFGLDEQAHQLGVAGKTHDLAQLALEFASKNEEDYKARGWTSLGESEQFVIKPNKKLQIADGLGRIPVDDERYINYLVGDVEASRAVAKKLLEKGPLNDYALREQRIASRLAAVSSNGFKVDIRKAQARVDELKAQRDEIMGMLVEKYDFPTEGKKPWISKSGKEAILKALADHGIDEGTRPKWPRTAKGGALQLGGEVLLELAEGADDEARELCQALATLMGQRSLAELALKCTHPDGFVHPDITILQRSGRGSTTNPGLTVWTARGEGAIEKEYFIPDTEDHALLTVDASNADARVVAWYSGDEKYAERFEPGADGHLINAWAAWGEDVVGHDKNDPTTAYYRQLAKPGGHGWGYRIGPGKLAATWGKPFMEAKKFLDNMNRAFHRVVAWQNAAAEFAEKHGYVINKWGRKMWVEHDRHFTQGPALLGQSGTREIMMDGLLAMPHAAVRTVKAWVHDEFVFSLPKARFEEMRDYLVDLLTVTLDPPRGGQRMDFPMTYGPPGDNWYSAAH